MNREYFYGFIVNSRKTVNLIVNLIVLLRKRIEIENEIMYPSLIRETNRAYIVKSRKDNGSLVNLRLSFHSESILHSRRR